MQYSHEALVIIIVGKSRLMDQRLETKGTLSKCKALQLHSKNPIRIKNKSL
jgi:hypothetical protein